VQARLGLGRPFGVVLVAEQRLQAEQDQEATRLAMPSVATNP
jgi:hypothetical protein